MTDLVQIRSFGNNLFRYVAEVNNLPLLTEEEELFHAKEKDKGNVNSAKILVSSHLRFVVKIAAKYKNYGLNMMDVISEGNIGLMRAVKTFDYRKGFRLATYSMWWIRACIQEFILKNWSLVKIGTNLAQKKLFFNLRKIKNRILSSFDRRKLSDDDIKSISTMLNVNKQEVINMDSRLSGRDLYLNAKSKSDSATEIIDLIPAKQQLPDCIVGNKREQTAKLKLLRDAVSALSDREREILMCHWLEERLTLSDIGKKYSISGERVRQIESAAIEKMKNYIHAHRLQ